MTRAEEAALKIFPVKKVPYYGLAIGAYSERDANSDKRVLFCMGYEQAEKDFGWHSVDECLPEIDEEVIVLLVEWNQVSVEPLYSIALGHTVNKEYCEDFNGWNIPRVKYWMPMPKLPEVLSCLK